MMAEMEKTPHTKVPTLEPEHCRAICEAIGDGLDYAFKRNTSAPPSHVQSLVDRLTELDDGGAPAIDPEIAPD
jgi:hypothetical protein